MFRAAALASLFFLVPRAAPEPQLGSLRVTVFVIAADERRTPAARHALLISDNPATSIPRRTVTASDGSATLSLRPGSYTIESDRPFVFEGKSYQWTQIVEVVAGRDTLLELTTGNAAIGSISGDAAAPSADAGTPESADTALLMQWQDSLVAVWTPTTRASGFVVSAHGLIATSQRIVGAATVVEVQLSATVKVAGNVLVSDAERDVAIIHVDPKVLASRRAVPLGCQTAAAHTLAEGLEIIALGVPFRAPPGSSSGAVSRVEAGGVLVDVFMADGAIGGPVFAARAGVVGFTSIVDEAQQGDGQWRGDSRLVGSAQACHALASAEEMMATSVPSGTFLPVEPVRPYPAGALENAAKVRVGSLNPYQMSSSDFDIAFITPVMLAGAEHQMVPLAVRPLLNFSNWAKYVTDFPPVLLVRVTPKLVESFWTTIARGAARTQGVSLPPIKRFKSGFLRARAFCGEVEVTPIHPFKVERRVSEDEAVYEGLYVFDPDAFGPHCGSARLELFSEKQPDKADTRRIDSARLQQIWQDFASYRDQN